MSLITPGAAERFRWALKTRRRPKSLDGYLRLWWADFVLHPLVGIGERCQDCGRDYVLWWADDDLYQEVYGSCRGTLCPHCFSRRAQAIGIVLRFQPVIVRRAAP